MSYLTISAFWVCSGDKKFLPDVLAEQQRVMAKHGDNLDFDILQEMDYLHRAIKEVGFPWSLESLWGRGLCFNGRCACSCSQLLGIEDYL